MVVRSRKNSKFLPEVVDKLFELMFETLHYPMGDPRRADPLWILFDSSVRRLVSKISSIDPLTFGADDSLVLSKLMAQVQNSAILLFQSPLFTDAICHEATSRLHDIARLIELGIKKMTFAVQ